MNYVVNSEKTSLDASVLYATNPEKTEQSFFTAVLNCESVKTAYVDGVLSGRTVSEPDRRLIIDYLKCMCFGFIIGWLATGMQEGIQSRFHRLCELKHGDLETMISRCEKK